MSLMQYITRIENEHIVACNGVNHRIRISSQSCLSVIQPSTGKIVNCYDDGSVNASNVAFTFIVLAIQIATFIRGNIENADA